GPARRHRALLPPLAIGGRRADPPVRHHRGAGVVGAARRPRAAQRPRLPPARPADRPDRGHPGVGDPMILALRELRRRPGRFLVAAAILTLIALLLMFLGGLLDG